MIIIIGNSSSKPAAVSNQIFSHLKFSLDDNLTWHWHSNFKPFARTRTHGYTPSSSRVKPQCSYSYARSLLVSFLTHTHCFFRPFRFLSFITFSPTLSHHTHSSHSPKCNQLPDNLSRFLLVSYFVCLYSYITIFPTTTH